MGEIIFETVKILGRDYPRGEKVVWKEFLKFCVIALPSLLTPVILLVGIYTGIMTPTEAGAVAGMYALLVSVILYRVLGWKALIGTLKSTVRDVGSTSIMIGAATVISYIVAREQLALNIGNWVLSITSSKYQFLMVANIVILILGMFVDTSAIQLVFLPIIIPVARTMGIDLVHFGIVVTFNMMVGLSTPPFGMLLFITSGISDIPLKGIMKEIFWPIVVMLIVLVLITYLPEIVLFLTTVYALKIPNRDYTPSSRRQPDLDLQKSSLPASGHPHKEIQQLSQPPCPNRQNRLQWVDAHHGYHDYHS